MTIQKQRGATFISWLMGAVVILFLLITGIKLAPVYLQYYTIRNIVDEMAANPETKRANKRIFRVALDKRLNINSLDKHLSGKNFDLIKIKGSNTRRKINVKYDVRRAWFANLDFIAMFDYSKEISSD